MVARYEAIIEDEVTVRRMRQEDVTGVILIEQAAYNYPWSEKIIRDCVRVGFQCWVIIRGADMLGFVISSVKEGECHILNLCVAPWARRCGYAKQLLSALLVVVRTKGAKTATLEVRKSNKGAQDLYLEFGFEHTGNRAEYYKDKNGREDALVLSRLLYDFII